MNADIGVVVLGLNDVDSEVAPASKPHPTNATAVSKPGNQEQRLK